MGRKKLKIRRMETMRARQGKFCKRKVGFVKKAKELATLCDTDVALVMFSPTQKPSIYVGHDKYLSTVLERLSNLSMESLEERRVHTKKLLEKMFSKKEEGTYTRNLGLDRNGVMQGQLQEERERLDAKKKMLSDWKNPDGIDDLEQIKKMEEQLLSTINKLKTKKARFQNKNNGA